MLNSIFNNAEQFYGQCWALFSTADGPQRVKDSKMGKRGRQKKCKKTVPRAAAAYGRQLKSDA